MTTTMADRKPILIGMKQRFLKSLAGIVMAILLFYAPGIKMPVLDVRTDAYFTSAIAKAGLTYATCRIINASVSIVKESNLQLEPGGVGLSLAVGQVLDPLDDMTERLSDVLVTAITSLGIQKLAYEISVSLVPPILAVCLFMLSLGVWFAHERVRAVQTLIVRLAVLVMIARCCLPLSSAINQLLHDHFFSDKIAAAKQELASGSAGLEKLKQFSLPDTDGLLGTIKNSAALLKQKSVEVKDALQSLAGSMGTIVDNLLRLTFLYVGVFMIQVIVLPVMVFWLLVKAANALFLTRFPVILHQPSSTSHPRN